MFTPAELRAQASAKIKERAVPLQKQVRARTRDGDTFRARVQGSERAPYRVTVNLKAGVWACTCPDEMNALCKHVYALLLVLETAPESFEAVSSRNNLPSVKNWSDSDVERLLDRLLEQHPQVVTDWARVVAEDRFDTEDDW